MDEHEIGSLDDITPGSGREFMVGRERIAVFRLDDGRVFASEAWCPHRGAPLVHAPLGDATVTCPLHGWRFDLTNGGAILGGCSLLTYPIRVDDQGRLHVTLPG